MKKKMISMLALISAAVMTISCGNNGASTSAEQSKNVEQNTNREEPAQTAEKVKIEYWFGLGSEAGKLMSEMVQEFNESQDKYEVVPVSQGNYTETYQKLQAAIASKTEPGVIISTAPMLHDLASKDVLLEYDPSEIDDDFVPVFIESTTVNGKIYGVPAYGTTQVIYFRKDLMEQAGIDPKEAYSTWENVLAASKKMVDQDITKVGHMPMWGEGNMIDLALSSGGRIISEDGTKVMINTPEWINSWEMIRKAIHDDKIFNVASGGQGWEYWYRTIDEVMNGAAMGYTGSSGDKGNLDFTIIDSLPQPGFNGNPGRAGVGTQSFAIPKNITPEEQEAAKAWIKFFTSPENSARWSIHIGYIPIREKAMEAPDYKAFIEENPYATVPYEQAKTGVPEFVDPTGGAIKDILSIAVDQVELENIPVADALNEAQEKAQQELDKVLGN